MGWSHPGQLVFISIAKNGLCGGEILLLRPFLLGNKMEYNHKIDYLMCKWLVPPRRNHREFRLRAVFCEKIKAKTKDEIRIRVFKSVFILLCANKIEEAVAKIQLFVKVNFGQVKTVFDETNQKKPDYNLFAYLLLKKALPFPYVVLYFNSLRVKRKLCPIIFRKDQIEKIIMFAKNGDWDAANETYRICLKASERYLIKIIPYRREEIFGIIKSIKEKLEAFKIVEVQVFGSYARDEANAYSDLDIVVVTRQSVIDSDYLFNLQIVLEEALKIPLDLHLFQNRIEYSSFDRKIRNDMVKVL